MQRRALAGQEMLQITKLMAPGVAHRYAIFLLKYSIGWRPKKDSIEKRPDWEKTRLRKDPIEKRPDWEKTRLRKDPIEKPGDWVTQGLRPYRRTDQEEFSFSQDRQTKLIKTVNYKSMGSQDGQIQLFRTVNYSPGLLQTERSVEWDKYDNFQSLKSRHFSDYDPAL